MATPRLGMVGFIVEDLARSLAFYRRLGLAFPEGSDAKTSVLLKYDENLTFFWSTDFAANNDPGRIDPGGGYRMLVEFFVADEPAVDRLYADLTAAGYHGHRAPFRTDFGAYMAMVDDPDANTVLITAA